MRDTMTSVRSYREALPQMIVREELVKGIGTQFDPEYARIMIQFMDEDKEYTLKEHRTGEEFGEDLPNALFNQYS